MEKDVAIDYYLCDVTPATQLVVFLTRFTACDWNHSCSTNV